MATHQPWSSEVCRLDDFVEIVDVPTELDEYPHAAAVEQRVVVYEAGALRSAISTSDGARRVHAEIAEAIIRGPGIVKIRRSVLPLTSSIP